MFVLAIDKISEEVFSYLERILIEWIPHDLMSVPNGCTKRLIEIILGKWIQFVDSEMVLATYGLNFKSAIQYFGSRESKVAEYYDIIEQELLKPEIALVQDSYVWSQLQSTMKKMIEFNFRCASAANVFQSFSKFYGKLHDCNLYPEIMGVVYKTTLDLKIEPQQLELLMLVLVWSIRQECLQFHVRGKTLNDFSTNSTYQVLYAIQCFIEVFENFDSVSQFHEVVVSNNASYLLREANQSLLFLNDIVYAWKARDSILFENITNKIDSFGGQLLEKSISSLKDKFFEHFNLVDHHSEMLFAVNYDQWKEKFSLFKVKWLSIEQNLIGIMNQAVESTNSIERKISIIHLFSSYKVSEKCLLFLENQKKLVNDLLTTKLHTLRKSFDTKKIEPEIPMGQYKYCGSANWALRYMEQTKYIENLIKTLGKSTDLKEIENFKQHIRQYVADAFQLWKSCLADDMDLYLKYPVLELDNQNIMRANLDVKFKNAIYEGMAWRKIGYELPDQFQYYITNFNELLVVNDKVTEVATKYNAIVQQAGNDFDCLFQMLKKDVLNVCQKGLYDLTWMNLLEVGTFCKNSTFSLVNLLQICTRSRKCLNEYLQRIKQANSQSFLEKVPFPAEGLLLEDFIQFLHDELNFTAKECRDIFDDMELLKTDLQKHMRYFNETIWANLRKEVLKMIHETLVQLEINICKELSNLLTSNVCENDEDQMQLLLTVKLESNNKMAIHPSQATILDQFNFFNKEVHEQLGQLMDDCKSVQFKHPVELSNNIPEFYKSCVEALDVYLQFKDIYELNKDAYIRRYSKQNPPLELYDADIQRYYEYMIQVNSKIESIQSVNLFALNHQEAKQSVVGHCMQWQDKLKELLAANTMKNIDGLSLQNIATVSKEIEEQMRVLEKHSYDIKLVSNKYKQTLLKIK